MTVGLYAGSMDPLTNGHGWVIAEGAKLFDRLIVAVGVNAAKRPLFTIEERMCLIREATAELRHVEVVVYPGQYLVSFAMSLGVTHILRGIRSPLDFQEELVMRHVNDDIGRTVTGAAAPPTSVFVMPPRELAEVSSSFVKGLVGYAGWEAVVARYVPAPVLDALRAREGRDG